MADFWSNAKHVDNAHSQYLCVIVNNIFYFHFGLHNLRKKWTSQSHPVHTGNWLQAAQEIGCRLFRTISHSIKWLRLKWPNFDIVCSSNPLGFGMDPSSKSWKPLQFWSYEVTIRYIKFLVSDECKAPTHPTSFDIRDKLRQQNVPTPQERTYFIQHGNTWNKRNHATSLYPKLVILV